MTAVVLYGSDKAVKEEIVDILSNAGGVIRSSDKEIIMQKDAESFLIVESSRPVHVKSDYGIVVFLDGIDSFEDFSIPKGFIAVTHSSNTKALSLLAGKPVTAISCGMAATDTITLSSIREDSAVISLQRVLTTIYGNEVEPGDFPVSVMLKENRNLPYSDYGLMAAATVLLLAGRLPEDGMK